MYECPNCTGNLKFDIATQALKCDYCGTTMNPYDYQKEQDATETSLGEDEYEVTVFTCPQCGGELISNDNTAATFCSFCGGSTILDSRISREKRPDYIIPFQKTAEDCREIYAEMMKGAIFAPSELKDKEYIKRFRSIYMPYWVYQFQKDGHASFVGSQTREQNDQTITQFFRLESDIQAGYKGITFDASASFSDNLSNAVAPFEWREARPFTPAFLSGFYADAGDVGAEVYEEDARQIVTGDMCREMKKDPTCAQYDLGDDLASAMRPETTKREKAMFPLWFLTYRKRDRVNYVVINGQTGKAAGDIPVDKRKYLMVSVLLAVPIFLLLNLFLTMRPSVLLILTAIFSLVCGVFSVGQAKLLRARRLGTDDKGRWGNLKVEEPGGIRISLPENAISVLPVCAAMLIAAWLAWNGAPQAVITLAMMGMLLLAGLLQQKVMRRKRKRRRYGISGQELVETLTKPVLGILISLAAILLQPSDWICYGAALVAMGMMVLNILELIDRYNLLATVELPQFDRRGGSEDGSR